MAGSGRDRERAARLAALEALGATAEERQALARQLGDLDRALDALEAFVGPATEPATGFDPALGADT